MFLFAENVISRNIGNYNHVYEVGLVVPCIYKVTLPRSAKLGKENLEILKKGLMEIDIMDEEYVTIAYC